MILVRITNSGENFFEKAIKSNFYRIKAMVGTINQKTRDLIKIAAKEGELI